ncbi:hypothetical protein L9F63_023112, partial [Diploptera punctata]
LMDLTIVRIKKFDFKYKNPSESLSITLATFFITPNLICNGAFLSLKAPNIIFFSLFFLYFCYEILKSLIERFSLLQ